MTSPTDTKLHPITPPDDLVIQWRHNWTEAHGEFGVYLATQAARWGADERQEAIIHWLITGPYGASIATAHGDLIHQLRNAMRPKPPSLGEQALAALVPIERSAAAPVPTCKESLATIRRALERLAELEAMNDD